MIKVILAIAATKEKEKPIIISCTLGSDKKYNINAFLDIGAISSSKGFINIDFAYTVSYELNILLILLKYPRRAVAYDGRKGPIIIYMFFLPMRVFDHTQDTIPLFVTLLKHYKIILAKK